jgi:predicted ABC-type sugar transport system permease subunit
MQFNVVAFLALLCILMKGFNFSTLEVVTDDELVNLVRTEKYVVVLFSEYPYHVEVMLLCITHAFEDCLFVKEIK